MLSGTGRFADQWHPFAQTSARLAAIAQAEGLAAEVASPDNRMADLSDAQLVVVNIGAPSAADPGRDAAGRRGLLDYLKRAGPALILHRRPAGAALPRRHRQGDEQQPDQGAGRGGNGGKQVPAGAS